DYKELRKNIINNMKLKRNPTMKEIAKAVGCVSKTDFEFFALNIEDMSKNNNLKLSPEMSVNEFMQAMYPDLNDAERVRALTDLMIKFMFRLWSFQANRGYKDDREDNSLTDKERETISDYYRITHSEDGELEEANEWVDHTEKGKEVFDKFNNSLLIIEKQKLEESINSKLNHFTKNKTKLEEAEARKRKSVSTAYPRIFESNEENPLEDLDIFFEDIDSKELKEICDKNEEFINKIGSERYNNKLSKALRPHSSANIFALWVLANYKDYNISNIYTAADNPALVEAFADFCDANPTMAARSQEEYNASVANWADVFIKGTEIIKNYQLKDIDFSNPKEVKTVLNDLIFIKGLCIDFLQEKDQIFKNNSLGLDGIQSFSDAFGEKKWNEIRKFYGDIQFYLNYVNNAYAISPLKSDVESSLGSAASKAINIYELNELNKKVANKKLVDAAKELSSFAIAGNYYQPAVVEGLGNGMLYTSVDGMGAIGVESVLDYLSGKNKKKFIANYKPIRKAFRKMNYESSVKALRTNPYIFIDKMQVNDVKELFMSVGDSADDLVSFLTYKDSDELKDTRIAGHNISDWISSTIFNLFNEDAMLVLLNINRNKYDLITIDGESARDLYEEKYKNVEEPLKSKCIEFEIIKEVIKAEKRVAVKTFSVDNKGDYKLADEMALSLAANDIQNVKYNYDLYKKSVESFVKELTDIQNELLKTHPGFSDLNEEKDNIGLVGSDLFKNMENSLKNCINSFKTDDMSIKQQINAFKDYENAANKYFKARDSIFGKHSDTGRDRLNLSDRGARMARSMINSLETLYSSVGVDLATAEGTSFKNAKLSSIDRYFEMIADESHSSLYRGFETNADNKSIDEIKDIQISAVNRIDTELKKLGKDYRKIMSVDKNPSYIDAAYSYVIKSRIDKLQSASTSMKDIKELNRDISIDFSDGTIADEVNRLSKNPIFKETIKQHKRFDYNRWKNIEETSKDLIDRYTNDMNNMESGNKNIVDYILGGANGQDTNTNKQYERLSEYVAKQILTDPTKENVVYAIASKHMKYKDVYSKTMEILKSKRAIERANGSKDVITNLLHNGIYKNEVTNDLVKQAKEKSEKVVIKPTKPVKNIVIKQAGK
nr:hypothetical protein [Lachnospiraceae bacterium]